MWSLEASKPRPVFEWEVVGVLSCNLPVLFQHSSSELNLSRRELDGCWNCLFTGAENLSIIYVVSNLSPSKTPSLFFFSSYTTSKASKVGSDLLPLQLPTWLECWPTTPGLRPALPLFQGTIHQRTRGEAAQAAQAAMEPEELELPLLQRIFRKPTGWRPVKSGDTCPTLGIFRVHVVMVW